MEKVGIRELRQNLSVYLKRVAEGERFTVTDHREPVAVIGPVPNGDAEGHFERLIEAGLLSRPTGDILDVEPAPGDPDDPYAVSNALRELREREDR